MILEPGHVVCGIKDWGVISKFSHVSDWKQDHTLGNVMYRTGNYQIWVRD